MSGVRTGMHMFAICVKTGIFKMRNTLFFHVWAPTFMAQLNHLFDTRIYTCMSEFFFTTPGIM